MTRFHEVFLIQARDILFLIHQAIIGATPLVIAGAGELVAERSGVINIGIEGLMLTGCFAAYVAAIKTGSIVCGLVAAMAAGLALAALFALVTIWLRADQIVSGAALNLLAAGLSATAWGALNDRLPAPEAGVAPVIIDYLAPLAAGLLVLAVGGVLRYTRAGLIVRALGDAPDACHAAGLRVRGWRTACVLFAGACAGAAGAYLSTLRVFQFAPDQTGGRGFLVLALVIFGRWNALGLIAGCLFFGMVDDLQRSLHGAAWVQWLPADLLRMLPYVATLAALATLTRSRAGPSHLGRPWPEER